MYLYSSYSSAGGAWLFQSYGLDSQKTQPDNMHTLNALQLALDGRTCQVNKCTFLPVYFAAQIFFNVFFLIILSIEKNTILYEVKTIVAIISSNCLIARHCWSCDLNMVTPCIFMHLADAPMQSDIHCI